MKDGIVIVGAGHGGSQAAISLRQEGYDGPLALVCEETDLPYHKPPLSKTFLKTPDAALQPLRGEKAYEDNAVTLRLGTRVEAIDAPARRLSLRGAAPIGFDRLVLATGARPRRLAVPGHDLDGVFYLRSSHDARLLRDAIPAAGSAVVIGGGFIGLEAAASLAQLGKEVTVIETAGRLLGRAVAGAVSSHMAAMHRALGVRLLTDASVERIEGVRRVAAVVTGAGKRIGADLVIVGIGAEPAVELAGQAGLACDNGVVVDADAGFTASAPLIHAIGDCAAYGHWQADRRLRLESVQNATDHARHMARALVGNRASYRDVPWFWSDQGPVKLQMAGLSFGADRQVISGSPEAGGFSVYHFRGERLMAVDSVNRPGDHMLARRMLAAGFSPGSGLIEEGAAACKAALEEAVRSR